AIYLDRGYKMVIFSSILEQLSNEVFEMIQSLGFKPKIYKVKQKFGTPFKYHVRLSKDVQKFIDLVRPEKR
ncbi:MAG TPA: hypothetical protein VFK07_01505, partial [Candidatus Paceibacterota bacterium]|nr:hypothetical protein [Candidatus Paceibacterota bacterium]